VFKFSEVSVDSRYSFELGRWFDDVLVGSYFVVVALLIMCKRLHAFISFVTILLTRELIFNFF